jgi:hypothetical protein
MNTLCTQPAIVKIKALDIESNFKKDTPSAEGQVLAVTMILSLTEYDK